MKNLITVLSSNLLASPLYEGDGADTIIIRDSDGLPMLLIKCLSKDVWAISKRGDSDFENILRGCDVKQ